MSIKQIIAVQEELIRLRELALEVFIENQTELANYIHERCNAIEKALKDS